MALGGVQWDRKSLQMIANVNDQNTGRESQLIQMRSLLGFVGGGVGGSRACVVCVLWAQSCL